MALPAWLAQIRDVPFPFNSVSQVEEEEQPTIHKYDVRHNIPTDSQKPKSGFCAQSPIQ